MAYIDRAENRDRSGPIVAVIAIHAGLGFVLVTGLSGTIQAIVEDPPIIGINIQDETPPDQPRPPEQRRETADSTPKAPETTFTFPRTRPFEVEPAELPEFDDVILLPPTWSARDLMPTTSFDPIPPRPTNDPAKWVTTRDYPSSPLRRGQEGIAKFRLEVAASGKVDECIITRSSGVAQLDQATCRYVSKRAKFHPARDGSDKPMAGYYESSVSWVIPD